MDGQDHSRHGHKKVHGQGYKGIADSDRKKEMDPDIILPRVGLKQSMTLVDVGCGQGFFALPAARIAGPQGRIYGIDIDEEALDLLKRRASESGLSITMLRGEAEKTIACEGCADIVLFGISLHDFREPENVLANAYRMLKPGGVLVDLDGKKAKTDVNPPQQKRLSETEASTLIEKAGFNIESIEEISDRLYLILARR
jgi:ubiquinone/menaquinone biosynthesis C-methylase UbiE